MSIRSLLMVGICAFALSANAQKPYHGDGMDNWLRFVPIASAYTLKAVGVESASSWKRLAVNTGTSLALTAATTWALKHTVRERRPDWTDRRSFPSGHTSIAFAGATILDKEFRKVSPWISVAGYAVATGVAVDRVARNRHHWYDVAAGAAIGVGGTFFGYWIGDKMTGEHSRYAVGVDENGVTAIVYF
jgi:membrane-associated phospholipid phosphatase